MLGYLLDIFSKGLLASEVGLVPTSIEESTTTIVAAASPPLPAYNARKEKESIGGGFAANVIHFLTKKTIF